MTSVGATSRVTVKFTQVMVQGYVISLATGDAAEPLGQVSPRLWSTGAHFDSLSPLIRDALMPDVPTWPPGVQ
jgi:hypothetical protein